MFEEQKIKEINQAVLVGLNCPGLSPAENASEDSLEELAALLDTAGGTCLGTVLQNKNSPDPRTFIGEGKVEEVRELAGSLGADLVIFDNPLSPSQQRVLTEELGVTVSVGRPVLELTHAYPDLTIHLTLFAASLTGEEPQRLEHADLRWMTWQEAQSYPFCPADQEILARLGQIVPFGKG